jgi:hypothetical protein
MRKIGYARVSTSTPQLLPLLSSLRRVPAHAASAPSGEKLIASERELDREFASHTLTATRLASLMAQIGEQQGALRAVHLKYHLTTAELLSDDQKQRYAEVRGYH